LAVLAVAGDEFVEVAANCGRFRRSPPEGVGGVAARSSSFSGVETVRRGS
jgi:hypothetical protein